MEVTGDPDRSISFRSPSGEVKKDTKEIPKLSLFSTKKSTNYSIHPNFFWEFIMRVLIKGALGNI